MTFYRCKMCGGDLDVTPDSTACICEFCGTEQTIPTNHDEELKSMYNRANLLRMRAEFDRASDIYEKIIQKDEKESEAYWGLILCRYGIEYVEDPVTRKRVPTCHRVSYDAVTADEDYKSAIAYADVLQKGIYQDQAQEIDRIQRDILSVAFKEEPYDIFICYKEKDENGQRTRDSVYANDIYYQLTQEGYKVFYSAISLEDKIGQEYEPYIFSALNTAKVMLVLGTKPEYFTSPWVKNEWTRYLKIIGRNRSRILIPCYRNMDPYDLPEEFAHLQAQDMEKIGFITDLIRGIKKIVPSPGNRTDGQETFQAKDKTDPYSNRSGNTSDKPSEEAFKEPEEEASEENEDEYDINNEIIKERLRYMQEQVTVTQYSAFCIILTFIFGSVSAFLIVLSVSMKAYNAVSIIAIFVFLTIISAKGIRKKVKMTRREALKAKNNDGYIGIGIIILMILVIGCFIYFAS